MIFPSHHWCTKLRHIRNMAETSLVMRDGNGKHNHGPTFLFSVQDHPRIPHVSKNMGTPHVGENAITVREPGNEHDRFAVAALKDERLCTAWFSARFLRYWKQSILRELSLQYSFLPVFAIFLRLASLLDTFHRHFLIMCHSLCCLNFYSCVTSHK